MKVTLRLFTEPCHPYAHGWELTSKRLFVTSNRDSGCTTKANAKRAALRWAERLGLSVVAVEAEA